MAVLEQLLQRTSRTFALSIPMLPPDVRHEVTVAYLLFRIADTFEDETAWPRSERVAALREFSALLTNVDAIRCTELLNGKSVALDALDHEGYAELLNNSAQVFAAWSNLNPASRACIAGHLDRTIAGMCDYITRDAGVTNLKELRTYCYMVAGIVGELCTELFEFASPSLAPVHQELIDRAPAFGEGLQLVNILRDERDDASEGRRYIPRGQERAELIELAAGDLQQAGEYVRLLEDNGAASGIIAFNSLNLLLAMSTLELIGMQGSGVKLARDEVMQIHESVKNMTARGESVMPLLAGERSASRTTAF